MANNSVIFCPLCSRQYKTSAALAAHHEASHKLTVPGMPKPAVQRPAHKSIKCGNCPGAFATQASLDQHRLQSHPVLAAPMAENNGPHAPTPPFVHPFGCNACPKSFTTAAAREEHYTAVHVGPSGRRFHCDLCPNKSFQVQKELHQHYKDTHPGRNIGRTPLPRAFICPSCSAQYQSKDCLEKHIQMTHSAKSRPPNSNDYNAIKMGFLAQWKTSTIPIVNNILKLPIPKTLQDKYERYKMEVVHRERGRTVPDPCCIQSGNEVIHYHGTSLECQLGVNQDSKVCNSGLCNCCNILKSGFKTTKAGARGFNRFGLGLYSTSISSKAHDYSAASENGLGRQNRGMLVCKVVAGRSHSTQTSQHFRESMAPPEGHDSILGVPGEELHYDELVVYNSRAMIATYLILYSY